MIKIVLDALTGGRVTEPLPAADGGFSGAAIGRYVLTDGSPAAVEAAIAVCPTRALFVDADALVLDEGRCVMCGLCAEGPNPAFAPIPEEPAVALARADLQRRFHLTVLPAAPTAPGHAGPAVARAAEAEDRLPQEGARLAEAIRRRFRRSLHIRHLDAGGCNGCEWELNQLQAPLYDLQRFGFDFVASPRHADLLLVTGVVTRNLELALIRTLDAMPRPRLVVAMGACAVSGGVFGLSYASLAGADRVVSVDAYIAGCPPRPWAVLRALHLVLA